MYIYAIVSLSFCFISLLLCIRFCFAKRAYIWVASCLLCLILGLTDITVLLSLVSTGTSEEVKGFAWQLSRYLCMLSGIWFLCIVFFRMRTNRIRRKEIERMQEIYQKAYIEHFTGLVQEEPPKGQVRTVPLPKADLSEEEL